jgi:phosphate starvation-inducible PhoH-like protein
MGKSRNRRNVETSIGMPSVPVTQDLQIKANPSPVHPKTDNQRKYINSINHNQITFGTGSAGTGKTFIAVKKACEALDNKQIERIIITRPIIEAGEECDLGSLPGSLLEKLEPHFASVMQVLRKHYGASFLEYLIKIGRVELCPTALCRGRTFDNCYVILDESQNLTAKSLKLFLTRLGDNSTMIINGDSHQVDINNSGLDYIRDLLIENEIKGIGSVEFTTDDIVRSPVVKELVILFDKVKI